MAYSVRIYRAGMNGEAVAELPVHHADTEGEAITIGMAQIDASFHDGQPRVLEVYDDASRLILSYTSEYRPEAALLYPSQHHGPA